MKVKFIIFARNPEGEAFECFRWRGDAKSGVKRAYAEAKEFGIKITEAWAVRFIP